MQSTCLLEHKLIPAFEGWKCTDCQHTQLFITGEQYETYRAWKVRKLKKYNYSPRDEIRDFCDNLKASLLEKYNNGEREHGTNWQGVDCWSEMFEEVKDLLNYNCIRRAQDKSRGGSNE